MRKEQHCELDAFASVLQFARELRRDAAAAAEVGGAGRVFVIGLVTTTAGRDESPAFDLRSSQLSQQALDAAQARIKESSGQDAEPATTQQPSAPAAGLTLAVVFGHRGTGAMQLTDSERAHCDLVVDCSAYALAGLNLPCVLSLVLHSLCVRLAAVGLVHAATIGTESTTAKFGVSLKGDGGGGGGEEQVGDQHSQRQREKIAATRAKLRLQERDDDLMGMFA